MIEVTIGTNTKKKKVIIEPSETLRNVLEDNEINYSTANLHLDGTSLGLGDIDQSFEELGITEKCFLIAVIKAENAVV